MYRDGGIRIKAVIFFSKYILHLDLIGFVLTAKNVL